MDGRKDDNQKDRWDLLPISAVEQVVKVLTFGAKKYDDDNWKKVPKLEARYYAAAQRHLTKHRQGELIDEESGLPHLACAICCLLFLLSKQVGFDSSLTEDPDAPIPYKVTEPAEPEDVPSWIQEPAKSSPYRERKKPR